MIIDYAKGKMFVLHSTGIVSEYSIEQLQALKNDETMEITRKQRVIESITTYLDSADASKVIPEPK